jgi:TonB family protein
VYLVLDVNPSGNVESVSVRRPVEGATEAAAAAARQWEYEPLVQDGKPVWFRITVGLPSPWPAS